MSIKVIDVGSGDYEPGDIVTLISGGPDMTVRGVCEDCGQVAVDWFTFDDAAGWVHEQDKFPAICLELAA